MANLILEIMSNSLLILQIRKIQRKGLLNYNLSGGIGQQNSTNNISTYLEIKTIIVKYKTFY